LECEKNQLVSLNVSNNSSLAKLNCGWNKLTTLDVSNCPALVEFYCSFNLLSSLDVTNNTNLKYFGIMGMSTLYKICVWQMPFPPNGVDVFNTDSPNVYFSTDCVIRG
jgi:Leucine-rich repeat (LRR) protein